MVFTREAFDACDHSAENCKYSSSSSVATANANAPGVNEPYGCVSEGAEEFTRGKGH